MGDLGTPTVVVNNRRTITDKRYLATVYTASSTTLAVVGYEGMHRRIATGYAENPVEFQSMAYDFFGAARDVDMLCAFGPVGEPWNKK